MMDDREKVSIDKNFSIIENYHLFPVASIQYSVQSYNKVRNSWGVNPGFDSGF